MPQDLKERCFSFSLSTIKFLRGQRFDEFSLVVAKQLMRSAVSVGANVTEAFNSSTRVEFRRYYEMALKSCNESKYWLKILHEGFGINKGIEELVQEATEISKMLAVSVIKLKQPQQTQEQKSVH